MFVKCHEINFNLENYLTQNNYKISCETFKVKTKKIKKGTFKICSTIWTSLS